MPRADRRRLYHGVIKDGELCIPYSEIIHFTPYGYDPRYPEYEWPFNSQFDLD